MNIREVALKTALRSETINVPEWDCDVVVKEFTAAFRSRLGVLASQGKMETFYPEIAIECTFSPETGERVFDKADVRALGNSPGGPLQQIGDAAIRLSGMAKTDLETAEKN